MRGICMDVAGMLEEVAGSAEEPLDEPPPRVSAAQRFAAAVQTSLTAADALGYPADDDATRQACLFPAPKASGMAFLSCYAVLAQNDDRPWYSGAKLPWDQSLKQQPSWHCLAGVHTHGPG